MTDSRREPERPAAPSTRQETTRARGAAPPTLHDVGLRAGVSAMTASRALRGDPRVSPRTTERIRSAAAELGYRRNELARGLRLGRTTGMIGLVVTNLANPFYSQLALGVEAVASAHGMKVVVSNTADRVEQEREIVDDLAARRVDGIIVVPAGPDHGHLAPAQLNDIPVVLATRPPVGIEVDCALLDDFGGAREATSLLVADGHRRIGFLGPPAAWTSAERLRGYRAVLEESGLALDEDLVRCEQRDIESARRAATRMLGLPEPPTAFFCANSRNTLGVARVVRPHPRRVAIFGFDDFELADMLDLSLRVVSYAPEALGRRAADLLFGRLAENRRTGTDERAPLARAILPTSVVDHSPAARGPAPSRGRT
ncbi:LacI family DNA-binding transcriptional regulator [Streptomyces sp. NPDC049954]|uniref:LacI family DNA-binding transcriptional regulator n=1 Tax=Streptomyces sp. NPDC049954 TaxID=3155779 RepID=UPI003432F66B